MLIPNFDGTYTGDLNDVICILKDVNANRFHVAFFEGEPINNADNGEPTVIRLKSKMHHKTGADDWEGALVHLEELKQRIQVPDGNAWLEPRDWNGEARIVWLIPRWFEQWKQD